MFFPPVILIPKLFLAGISIFMTGIESINSFSAKSGEGYLPLDGKPESKDETLSKLVGPSLIF